MNPKEAIEMSVAMIRNGEIIREKAELCVMQARDKFRDDATTFDMLDKLAAEIRRIPTMSQGLI